MKKVEFIFIRVMGISLIIANLFLVYLILTTKEIPHIWNLVLFSPVPPIVFGELFVDISKVYKYRNAEWRPLEVTWTMIGYILILLIGVLCLFGTIGIMNLYSSCFKLYTFVFSNWVGIIFIYAPRLYKAKERIVKSRNTK